MFEMGCLTWGLLHALLFKGSVFLQAYLTSNLPAKRATRSLPVPLLFSAHLSPRVELQSCLVSSVPSVAPCPRPRPRSQPSSPLLRIVKCRSKIHLFNGFAIRSVPIFQRPYLRLTLFLTLFYFEVFVFATLCKRLARRSIRYVHLSLLHEPQLGNTWSTCSPPLSNPPVLKGG